MCLVLHFHRSGGPSRTLEALGYVMGSLRKGCGGQVTGCGRDVKECDRKPTKYDTGPQGLGRKGAVKLIYVEGMWGCHSLSSSPWRDEQAMFNLYGIYCIRAGCRPARGHCSRLIESFLIRTFSRLFHFGSAYVATASCAIVHPAQGILKLSSLPAVSM